MSRLSVTEIGAVAVAAVMGSLLGSLVFGPITDKLGRQIVLRRGYCYLCHRYGWHRFGMEYGLTDCVSLLRL